MAQGLQLVIGAEHEKGFSVFTDQKTNTLRVYYGMNFYDSAPIDDHNFEYKLMLGRLYCAGIKVKTLIEHFGFSYPTYKRWGDALKSGDEEAIFSAFSGQGGYNKKLSPEIISFIVHSFEHVYRRNKYSYSKEIRQDIQEVFGVEFSSECLRPLFGQLRQAYHANDDNLPEHVKKRIYKEHL